MNFFFSLFLSSIYYYAIINLYAGLRVVKSWNDTRIDKSNSNKKKSQRIQKSSAETESIEVPNEIEKESEDDNGQWKGKNDMPTDNWAQKWKRKWNTKRKRNVIYFTICSIWKMNKTFIHFFSMHLAYCVLSSASLFRKFYFIFIFYFF